MKIAIVKPDHLGDLVLSAAAIRAVRSRYADLTLFVASRNFALARLLFGDIDLRALDLPHLRKGGQGQDQPALDFAEFDLVLFLRHDQVLNPERAQLLCNDFIFFPINDRYHQTLLDYVVASRAVGRYDIDAMFFDGRDAVVRPKAYRPPNSVGLCIAAGFYANSWPLAHWVTLGRALQARGRRIALIAGPSEKELARVAARTLGLGDTDVIVGSDDFSGFFARVGELDWVIASDGGTAHLCSLAAPVLSLFGGSPFRRYAPFGAWNRLLTLELPCSPCCQYMSRALNGCLSAECLVGITPAIVLRAIESIYDEIAPSVVEIGDHCRLYFGASHLDRAELEAG
jgi:heptosyltransferase-2